MKPWHQIVWDWALSLVVLIVFKYRCRRFEKWIWWMTFKTSACCAFAKLFRVNVIWRIHTYSSFDSRHYFIYQTENQFSILLFTLIDWRGNYTNNVWVNLQWPLRTHVGWQYDKWCGFIQYPFLTKPRVSNLLRHIGFSSTLAFDWLRLLLRH